MATQPDVTVRLTSNQTRSTLGARWQGTVGYYNMTDAPFALVPVQATPVYLRTNPRALFELRKDGEEKWRKLEFVPGCGNTDRTLPKDFEVLQPHEGKYTEASFTWDEATVGKECMTQGKYWLRVVYDTSRPLDAWVGGPLPAGEHEKSREDIRKLWEMTPHGTYTSPILPVTIN